jgi:hypothetical protein
VQTGLARKNQLTMFDFSEAIREANLEQYFPRYVLISKQSLYRPLPVNPYSPFCLGNRTMQRMIFELVKGEKREVADVQALMEFIDPRLASTHSAPAGSLSGGLDEIDEEDQVTVDEDEMERITKFATYDPVVDNTRTRINAALHQKCRSIKVRWT